jgi:hypothetical protein
MVFGLLATNCTSISRIAGLVRTAQNCDFHGSAGFSQIDCKIEVFLGVFCAALSYWLFAPVPTDNALQARRM